MTKDELFEWYQGYGRAINAHELDGLGEFIHDEVVLNGSAATLGDVIATLNYSIDAVPDLRWELDEFLVDGDRVAVRAYNTGTPAKEWIGAPATGASFKIREYAIYRVTDGKFSEMTFLHDSADLLQQLGA